MQNFDMSGEQMDLFIDNLKTIQDKMESSYTQLEQLLQRIDTEQAWDGDEVDAFLAYMELMKVYHGSFTDRGQREGSLGNPLGQALEALEAHGNRVDSFYEDYTDYKNMENVQ